MRSPEALRCGVLGGPAEIEGRQGSKAARFRKLVSRPAKVSGVTI